MVSYILACIVIGATGVYLLASTGRTVGAFTFLVGAITVFIIFGLRWFRYGIDPNAPKSWPPIVNTCPDYLVYYERSGKPTCIDVLGVSTKPADMMKWTGQETTLSDKQFFSLEFQGKAGVSLFTEMCERTKEHGLTWEGISNGETCYNWTKQEAGLAGASASGCPAT